MNKLEGQEKLLVRLLEKGNKKGILQKQKQKYFKKTEDKR